MSSSTLLSLYPTIVQEKPSFRNLLKRNRCVVFFDGYFEWKGQKGSKQPYFIHGVSTDGEERPLLMAAALYDTWSPQNLTTVTILTRAPIDEGLDWIHDRQPVFFTEKVLTTSVHSVVSPPLNYGLSQESALWLGCRDYRTVTEHLEVKRISKDGLLTIL